MIMSMSNTTWIFSRGGPSNMTTLQPQPATNEFNLNDLLSFNAVHAVHSISTTSIPCKACLLHDNLKDQHCIFHVDDPHYITGEHGDPKSLIKDAHILHIPTYAVRLSSGINHLFIQGQIDTGAEVSCSNMLHTVMHNHLKHSNKFQCPGCLNAIIKKDWLDANASIIPEPEDKG